MSDLIKLWQTDDRRVFTEGDYGDDANGVSWMWTSYSDTLCSPRCGDDHCYLIHPNDCVTCGNYVNDMDHYMCLDGGEAAHLGCVVIHSSYPHQEGTLYDCPACDMDDDDE